MLSISGIHIYHTRDLRPLIQDFSLSLQEGDKAALIGEEGNGKSTLLRYIAKPELIEDYAEVSGKRQVSGEVIGYLPQELPSSCADLSLWQFFSEEEGFLEQSPRDLALLAKKFQVDADFYYRDQPMSTLSGGEKVKAQLLRIFMKEPTVLLLDEPTNDMDINTLRQMEQVILDFKGPILYISHDETLIEKTANMIIHLEMVHRKKTPRHTICRMDYHSYRKSREDAFQRQMRLSESDRRAKKERDETYRRIFQKVEHEQNVVSRQVPSVAAALKKKMHTVKSMGRRFEREDENMTERPVREEAIDFSFGEMAGSVPDGKRVLDLYVPELRAGEKVLAREILLEVRGPEKICIIGANGCGKSTLIRQIADNLQKREDIRFVYMPQNYEDSLISSMDPVEYLLSVTSHKTGRITLRTGTAAQQRELRERAGRGEITEKEWETYIRNYLGALRFTEEEMHHPIRDLSGGQKAKMFLLQMNLSQANVLVLDEPTRNFSPLSAPVIREILRGFPGAILSVSHDRSYIRQVCDKVYLLEHSGLKELPHFISEW